MNRKGLSVIDFHAHFPVAWDFGPRHELIDRYTEERNHRMLMEWDLPDPEPGARTDEEIDEAADRWAAEVEKYQLDRVVFVTGRDNDTLARIVRKHPRSFMGFAFNNPTAPDAVDELRRAVDELGLVGYKTWSPRFDIPFEDPKLHPLWRFIADRRLPVIIHFGLLGHAGGVVHHPLINPLTLYPVAREYAEIPFVIPHFGCGYWQELLQLCWSCPNIHVDTSGSNQWTRWMPYPLTLEDLFRKAYETIGPRRIIFGTDSSWFPRGFSNRYLLDQIRVCRWLNFKEEDIQAIFSGNARRLLGLDSNKK